MTDIQTIWDVSTGTGDYEIKNGELSKGHDVRTSVLISLFTDRVADVNDELPDNTQDRRGWWGDTGQKYSIGSRLYLLDRSKAPTNIELEAINYASEAVQWMIDDNIVAKFDIQAKFIHNNQLRMIVIAYRQDGSILSKISEELW